MQGEHGSCRGRSGRSHLHIGVVQRGLHGHDEEVLLLEPGIDLALALREGTERSKKRLGQSRITKTTRLIVPSRWLPRSNQGASGGGGQGSMPSCPCAGGKERHGNTMRASGTQ